MGRCLWGPTANPSDFPSEIYPSYVRPLFSYQFAYFDHICNTAAALRLFQHHTGFGAPKHQEWGKTSLMPLLLSSLPFSLILKNCTQLCPKDLDRNSLLQYVPSQKAKSFSKFPSQQRELNILRKQKPSLQMLRLRKYSKLQVYLAVPSATLHTTQELLFPCRNT